MPRATGPRSSTSSTPACARSNRIAQTVDELLVLSRTGERDAPGELLDIAEAAHAAGRRWQPAAAVRNLALHVEAAAPTRPVWCARADLDRALFARFQRGSAGASAPNGTGLGLAIARELMRCRDGEAELSNRDGAGLGQR